MKGKRHVKWSHSISEMKKNLMKFPINHNNYRATHSYDSDSEHARD
jgi:hypothetical protein